MRILKFVRILKYVASKGGHVSVLYILIFQIFAIEILKLSKVAAPFKESLCSDLQVKLCYLGLILYMS